jgi:23S rRNA (adenine2503-C2)-methyltransferase
MSCADSSQSHSIIKIGAAPKKDILDFSRDELTALITDKGFPRYRAIQLFEWVHKKKVSDLSLMTDLPKDIREVLPSLFDFPVAAIESRQISTDGTRKYLFKTSLGNLVESVMIKQPNRMTLCVSSQIGCGMGCSFCRTGTMGFIKNLTTSEILQQVRGVIEDAKNFGDMFTNIVFMGMGEPLHNFNNVCRALTMLRDQKGYDFSGRKITISSVGLVPAIAKFGQAGIDVNLAISLNATTDEVRDEIMPINKKFPLAVLLQTLRDYPLKHKRKITIEYVMLAGVNDSEADMRRLPGLLKGIPSKVNLIPYNANAGLGFEPPSRAIISQWMDYLFKKGIDTTIRWSKGVDISAACGQLAVNAIKEKKKREATYTGPSLAPDAQQQLEC